MCVGEKTTFTSVCPFCPLVKDQLTVHTWFYFWALFYWSISLLFDHHTIWVTVARLNFRECQSSYCILLIICMCAASVWLYTHEYRSPGRLETLDPSGAGVGWLWAARHRSWELNSGLLQEQYVLSAISQALFFHIVVAILSLLPLHINFESIYWFPHTFWGFFIGIALICRLSCQELTSDRTESPHPQIQNFSPFI